MLESGEGVGTRFRRFGKELLDEGLGLFRQVGISKVYFLTQNLFVDFSFTLPRKWQLAYKHLVCDDSDRPYIDFRGIGTNE